jgi:hypothetical protein
LEPVYNRLGATIETGWDQYGHAVWILSAYCHWGGWTLL